MPSFHHTDRTLTTLTGPWPITAPHTLGAQELCLERSLELVPQLRDPKSLCVREAQMCLSSMTQELLPCDSVVFLPLQAQSLPPKNQGLSEFREGWVWTNVKEPVLAEKFQEASAGI